MFSANQYELVDFGRFQKLERFNGVLVARPCPAASNAKRNPAAWENALTFVETRSANLSSTELRGEWLNGPNRTDDWVISWKDLRFNLKPTSFGHLGIFPEQAANWQWIEQVPIDLQGKKALNLFAYTGGTSLALARRGVEVVHIDSAQNVVNWARENAKSSGLGDHPIRWIAEDATKFVARECRRGNRYDIVVADPPSFGRGPKGEIWKIQSHLEPLIDQLAEVTNSQPDVILLSCHTQGFEKSILKQLLQQRFELGRGIGEAMELDLARVSEKRNSGSLSVGECFRWFSKVQD